MTWKREGVGSVINQINNQLLQSSPDDFYRLPIKCLLSHQTEVLPKGKKWLWMWNVGQSTDEQQLHCVLPAGEGELTVIVLIIFELTKLLSVMERSLSAVLTHPSYPVSLDIAVILYVECMTLWPKEMGNNIYCSQLMSKRNNRSVPFLICQWWCQSISLVSVPVTQSWSIRGDHGFIQFSPFCGLRAADTVDIFILTEHLFSWALDPFIFILLF